MSPRAMSPRDAAAARIIVRQAMQPSSAPPTNSPDIISTGTSASLNEDAFDNSDAYDWYFSQASVMAQPNYLYVRGCNATDTGRTSRAYLYFVQSDQLLDPSKWQSSGFTFDNAAQNYVDLVTPNRAGAIVHAGPLLWTPPTPTISGAFYYLLCFVDNGAEPPTPPTFPSSPFENFAAFVAYVSANPDMAVLDTVYRGAFVRQFAGQTVVQPGNGTTTSPDIVSTGPAAAKDAAAYTTAAAYGNATTSPNIDAMLYNFIYLRAKNTANGPAKARIYLFWTPASSLTPPGWRSTDFSVAGQTQNWVDVSASAEGEIMISTVPIVWNVSGSAARVLVAYVDNNETPQPPNFSPFGFLNPDVVRAFVAGQPQLAWLATVTATPQPFSTTTSTPLAAGAQTSPVYAGVQLANVPVDGTVSFSVPGPDAANTIVISNMRVPDPNALVAWPVTYPAAFQTSAVITYAQGSTPVGAASLVAVMVPRPGSAGDE